MHMLRRSVTEENSMPLSPPQARERLHTRAITINGWRRADGLYDIEAELADTKTFGFPNQERGFVHAGEKLHGMAMRITVNEDMLIVACEAATDFAPFGMCPSAAANFSRLAGLTIGRGFLKAVASRVGGTQGCTHLRELLQQMATTAFQTVYPARVRREALAAQRELPPGDGFDAKVTEHYGGPSSIVNSCLAYAEDGPLVQRRWPQFSKAAKAGKTVAATVSDKD